MLYEGQNELIYGKGMESKPKATLKAVAAPSFGERHPCESDGQGLLRGDEYECHHGGRGILHLQC